MQIRLRKAMQLYQERTGKRITYEDIAARTGLSLATLQSIGARAGYNPTLRTLESLCKALDCNLSELIEERKEGREPNED